MSFNIMDLVKNQISNQVMGQVGNLLGGESSKAEAGLAAVIPGLLSGLTERASLPGGADKLFEQVSNQDDGLLDNVGSMLAGGQGNSLVENGTKMLGGLFGNSGLGSLAGVLSGVSGVSKAGSSSLLGLAAPIIMGVLKRKVMGDGLNASGLLSMLKSQKDNVNAAMPAGLADQLTQSNFLGDLSNTSTGNVSSIAKNATSDARETAAHTASSGSSFFKKWLPLLAIALLGLLAWKFFSGSNRDALDQTKDAANNTAAKVADAASVDVDALGGEFTGLFDSAKTSLEGITSVDTANGALPQLTELSDKVSGLTGMLDKVPAASRGPLTGIISTGLETLMPIIEKLRALPGVGAVIDPVITPLVESLQAMAG